MEQNREHIIEAEYDTLSIMWVYWGLHEPNCTFSTWVKNEENLTFVTSQGGFYPPLTGEQITYLNLKYGGKYR